jgi:hypothetical protein
MAITMNHWRLIYYILKNIMNILTCITRQRTGKHLATEYTHATIELRMLLLVARQQSARQ